MDKITWKLKIWLAISVFGLLGFKSKSSNIAEIQHVKIGEQVWMSENLNTDYFVNGKKIHEAKSIEEWEKAIEEFEPAWCYYEFNPENGKLYGKIYNYWAVSEYQGLASKGWRIPSDEDWSELENYLGKNAGEYLKSSSHWLKNGIGSDKFNFSALPGGCFQHAFHEIGESGQWWSSTAEGDELSHGIWTRKISHDSKNIKRVYSDLSVGCSVRLIKEK
jgi:uncharacterized protein (TIGR02145 family)